MRAVAEIAGVIVVAVVIGWAVPALAMRMLLPSLETGSPKVANYRGHQVPTGLGVAWLIWSVVYLTLFALVSLTSWDLEVRAMLAVSIVPALLVPAVFAFGLVDDALGGAGEKGFRGHLSAMAHGRLTTGGLKLVGIGLVAVVVSARPLTTEYGIAGEGAAGALWVAAWVLRVLVIALAANLVNLTDLRPGRALKSYAALTIFALALTVLAPLGTPAFSGPSAAGAFVAQAVLFLGPAIAIWRYDLGERAMLGDAGANVMGALAGYLLATSLPLWGLGIAAAALLALNLLSEKISFSKVVEGNRGLRWIDDLGRLDAVSRQTDEGSSPPDGNE